MSKTEHARQRRLEARIFRARLTLFMERLWPALLPALGVAAVFLLVTLFDLWRYLPWFVHYGVLALLIGAAVFLLVRELKDMDWPTRTQAQNRLEKDAHVPHAALRATEDLPFSREDENNPLWRAHMARMDQLSTKARLDKGRATADRRDPFYLRYAAVLMLAVAVFVAWGDYTPRFWNAVSPRPANMIPASVDLWVDPPAYTGRAPIVLVQAGTLPDGSQPGIAVPEGAVLHARINGADRRGPGRAQLVVETDDGRETPDLSRSETALIGETALTANAAVTLRVNGQRASWPVIVAPDEMPEITFEEDPVATEDGRIRLVARLADDYGITEADAVMTLDPEQDRPLDAPAITPERAAQEERVAVSGITGSYGVRSAELDLREHPWAGLTVRMRLVGRDGAGQEATTETFSLTLPEREFYNPLARAIIYERRNLAVAPTHWTQTTRSLDALTFAPDRFYDSPSEYLLLRAAYWSAINGRGENVDDMIAEFWPLALQLEDEALELARRALEAAQQALREALERGASDAEVERLVENLRTAMQNYIQALAESGQAMADGNGDSRELEARDLDDMLNSITELSQSGAQNAARQLLSELEQMLQNLQITQGGGSGQQQAGQQGQGSGQGQGGGEGENSGGSDAARQTGDLIARQRELTDETFEAQRDQFAPNSSGGNAPSAEELRSRQEDLSGQVDQLLQQQGQGASGSGGQSGQQQGEQQGNQQGGQDSGTGLSDEAAQAFRRAQQRMSDASDALRNGNLGAAGAFQEEALEALREGADGISDQMMQAQQNGQDGEGQQAAQRGPSGAPAQVDPLGRPYGAPAPSGDIGIPDLSDPERARELIMELRRRLSEPGRSEEEIEYLERLLERF